MEVKDIDIKDDVVVVKMEVNQLPELSYDRTGEYVSWGKKNDWPRHIINLFQNHPEHGAIVEGKARYLSGLGIKPSIDLPEARAFLSRANRFEDVYKLGKKLHLEQTLFGGFAVQVNTNPLGRPVAFYHLDWGKLRLSSCKTGVWYSEDWDKHFKNKTFFPFYRKGIVGTSIYIYKNHVPSIMKYDGFYPVPDYARCLNDIDTDIEIGQFFNMLVKNGFSAGHIITFFNGKLTQEKKDEISSKFEGKHTGTKNAGKVVLVYTNPDGKGTQVENVTPNGLAEQYELLNKRNENKIIRGHNVPRALFKMETEGSLGDRTVLDLNHELFINEFALPNQKPFLSFLQTMFKDATDLDCEFETEQIKLIGKKLDLNNSNIVNILNAKNPAILSNYIIKEFALDVPVDEILPTQQLTEGNDKLSNLTGRQRSHLDTIARKYVNKKLTEQQAILQLMPFGFSESDAKLYLGIEVNNIQVQQSKQDKFLEWVKLNTIEIDPEDEILDERPYNFQLKDRDREDYKIEDGNLVPRKSFIKGLIDSFRNKNKDTSRFDTEVYTVYKYDLRPELKAKGEPLLLDNSHDFCFKMVEATSGNKRLTFDAIDKMENDFGDNAWDNRGGFWGKKKTCRHLWIAETRIRKVKK
jgi:hypothetical protein